MGSSTVKKVFIVISIAAMLVVSSGSFALGSDDTRRALMETRDTDPAAMVVDFAVARPVGFAALVTGAVFFTVSLPFSALGGNTEVAFEKMVMDSARYTFLRPLGGF